MLMSWYHPLIPKGHSCPQVSELLNADQLSGEHLTWAHSTRHDSWGRSNLQHLDSVLKMLKNILDLGGIDASSRLTVIALSVNQSRITDGQNWLHYFKTLWHASRGTLLTPPGTNFLVERQTINKGFCKPRKPLGHAAQLNHVETLRCIKLHSKQ